MPLLIDGYNLMYAAGILGGGSGPGALERRRLALLNFLAESLDPEELPQTTVVFDAREPPWGLKQSVRHRGILVRFATKYESADALIEELIRAASAPRRLVVVSSDHEIQRAARRRRASAVDSEAWYAELVQRRRQRQQTVPEPPDRPPVPLLEEDVNYWLRQFGGEPAQGETVENSPAREPDDDNPFPPDYGKDLESL
jgi:predicted RNA-binding protein with PIN domain